MGFGEQRKTPRLAVALVTSVPGSVGALHMLQKHGVSRTEVEQVLLQVPPIVEARRSPEDPGRTLFWGATRYDRWLFVVCEDIVQGGVRKLTPITAFEPEEGELYWRKYGKR